MNISIHIHIIHIYIYIYIICIRHASHFNCQGERHFSEKTCFIAMGECLESYHYPPCHGVGAIHN